jgi:4-amino-4-deoxy-L-arabinose transferase-like glycosyltransferase
MNAFEPLFWTGCALAYVLAIKRANPRYWLLFGALAGFGLMNKHSLVFFGLAFVVGLLFTQEDRKFFIDKFFWLAGVIAFLIFLPN